MKKQTINVADKQAMTHALNSNGVEEYAVKKMVVNEAGPSVVYEFTFKCEASHLFNIGDSYRQQIKASENKTATY